MTSTPPSPHRGSGLGVFAGSDVAVRVGSAIILAALALLATWASPWTFALLIAAGAVLVAWEWSRLVRGEARDVVGWVHAAVVALAVLLAAIPAYSYAWTVVVIGALAILFMLSSRPDTVTWSLGGLAYVSVPALALVWIRNDAASGWAAILYLFLIVWCADTAAFAAGRMIGGARLAPAISPNKTWSGFVAGALVPAALGSALAVWWLDAPPLALGLQSFVLALAAMGGDLGESALKRMFGAKDAGDLIPGHGGLLDRVDGFAAAAVVAGLLAVTRGMAHPAHALIFAK